MQNFYIGELAITTTRVFKSEEDRKDQKWRKGECPDDADAQGFGNEEDPFWAEDPGLAAAVGADHPPAAPTPEPTMGSFDVQGLGQALLPTLQASLALTVKGEIHQALGEVKAEVGEIEVKVIDLDERLKAVEARNDFDNQSMEGSAASMEMRSSTGGVPFGGGGREFVPRHVILKGWCLWDDRSKNGLDHDAADKWVAEIKKLMPKKIGDLIRDPEYFGLLCASHRLLLP